jgi:hypothetical protein
MNLKYFNSSKYLKRNKCKLCKETIFNRRGHALYCKPCSLIVKKKMNQESYKRYIKRLKNEKKTISL